MSRRTQGEGRRREVLLVGNPNCGKTTLFNALAGTRARTGNYPGVTVDRRSARIPIGAREVELVDLPGTYSLTARSPEEHIAADAVMSRAPGACVVVIDATTPQRGLYLAHQIRETGVPTVLAFNMMDELKGSGGTLDLSVIEDAFDAPVIPLVASRGEGLGELRNAIDRALRTATIALPLALDPADQADVAELAEIAPAADRDDASGADRPAEPLAWARWALLSLDADDELSGVASEARAKAIALRDAAQADGRDLEAAIVGARYAKVDEVCARAFARGGAHRSRTDRLDRWLVHPAIGTLVFALVMFGLFELLFTGADPAIGLIEDGVGIAQEWVLGLMDPGPLRDLLVSGVIAGVGNVVVFVPQIALLFLLIAFLEDCGYLARVAFVIDRLMKGVGLHGKAFVPLLSGFACAIPAVMATRTIESRKDRLVTMMALPLMSCSARLPVYLLVVAVVFAGEDRVLGVFSVGAVVLFSMYALSVIATLAAAAVFRRTVLRGPRPALVLELPPYRMPLLGNLVRQTWTRVRTFLVDAGTIILALTIVLWALLTYPHDTAAEAAFEAARHEATEQLAGDALATRLETLEAEAQAAALEHSAAGRLGKALEPALEPLGMDWRIGVGVIGAFAAREVFVSTLGMVFGVGEADEESAPLRERLQSATRPDGSPLMTPLSGIALLVFFVLAAQCMSTLAVVKREAGSWKWPVFMFVYMTGLAYVGALTTYQLGAALGWGTG